MIKFLFKQNFFEIIIIDLYNIYLYCAYTIGVLIYIYIISASWFFNISYKKRMERKSTINIAQLRTLAHDITKRCYREKY